MLLVLIIAISITQVAECSFLHRKVVPHSLGDRMQLATSNTFVKHEVAISSTKSNSSLSTYPVFEHIAASNSWGSQETISGPGSDMAATETVRATLGRWIQEHNVKLFLDVPCGDANWQGSIPGLESIQYQGYDISHTAVENAQRKNQQRAFMRFEQFDLTGGVPSGKPDLFLLRDVIQHVPLDLGRAMLLNVKRTGVRWLAVTSWRGGTNFNIAPGNFYANDVHQPPFNLPAPVDECRNYDKLNCWDAEACTEDKMSKDRLELIDLNQWNPSGL